MTKATISRRQLRWGVPYLGARHDWGGHRGWTLTRYGHVVGWRIGGRGWLVMPLHRLAERLGPGRGLDRPR